jgi:hypothetical protein
MRLGRGTMSPVQIRESLSGQGQGAGPSKQTMAILAVVIALFGVLAYGLAPFKAAGGLRCGSALLGSSPKERVTTGLLVGKEESLCQSKGNSRLMVVGIATVVALVLGLGAVFLPVGPLEEFFLRRE